MLKQYAGLASAQIFYANIEPFIDRLSAWLSYNVEQANKLPSIDEVNGF